MLKINIINSNHNLFERRLYKLADAPKKLHYIGKLPDSKTPTIAIIGSRKPTPYGKDMAYRLAYDLAKQGVVIISGLALGIDAIAHQAALDAKGTTVAVLAGGLDHIYPHQHRELAATIINKGGALLSEYPPGTPSLPHQFIARNRLVAALSDGVLITEAAAKSGSLHTASFALDMGIPVMAVPGLVTNPMASGCLQLLRSGAALITNTADVLQAAGYSSRADVSAQLTLELHTAEEIAIFKLLQQGVTEGEELLIKSKLSPALFNQTLTLLELNGVIRALGANHWQLISTSLQDHQRA